MCMVCVPGEAGDGRVCALARACRQRCNCTDAAAAAPPARAPPPPHPYKASSPGVKLVSEGLLPQGRALPGGG